MDKDNRSSWLVIIVLCAVLIAIFSLPTILFAFDVVSFKVKDDKASDLPINNTSHIVGEAPDFPLFDKVQDGQKRLSDHKGNVIVLHLMYFMHMGGDETSFEEENTDQFDILVNIFQKYHDENVTFVTVLLPSCCLPPREIWIDSIYEESKIKWHFEVDMDFYFADGYHKYVGDERSILVEDPTIVIINQDFNIVSVSGFLSLSEFDEIILNLNEKGGNISEEDLPEQVDQGGNLKLAGAYGSVMINGFYSSIDPCCLGLLFVTIAFLEQIIDQWDKKGENVLHSQNGSRKIKRGLKKRATVALAFCIGMGALFFGVGLISSVLVFVPYQIAFKIIAGIIVILLGFQVMGLFRKLKELFMGGKLNETKDCSIGDHHQHQCSHDHQHQHGSRIKSHTVEKFLEKLRRFPLWSASMFGGAFFGFLEIPGDIAFILPAVLILISLKVPVIMIGLFMFIFGIAKGAIIIPFLGGMQGVRRVFTSRKFGSFNKVFTVVFGLVLVGYGFYLIFLFSI